MRPCGAHVPCDLSSHNVSTIRMSQMDCEWDQTSRPVSKQTLIDKNNEKENAKRIDCDHAVGDSIMKIEAGTLKMEQPREGPLNVVRAHASGAIATQKGPIEERLNTRQATPCVE